MVAMWLSWWDWRDSKNWCPFTLPIGYGKLFGVYKLSDDTLHTYSKEDGQGEIIQLEGPNDSRLDEMFWADLQEFRERHDLVTGVMDPW